jgi:hypothetical protein
MTARYGFAFSRRDMPESLKKPSAPKRGRAGMPGAQCTRSLVCESGSSECTRVFTAVAPEITRHPRTQWFTAYFVISPAIGLFCHRRLQRLSCKLDASVEASGPHDFSVRKLSALVSRAARVHRIPPRVCDDGQRPSVGQDGCEYRTDLGLRKIRIFLQKGLDRHLTKQPGDLPVGLRVRAMIAIPSVAGVLL